LKLLITGGSGFIGRNLAEQYSGRHEVLAPSRSQLDLLDAVAVRDYLETHRFDVVIHAAADRSNRGVAASSKLLDRNCRMFFHLARHTSLYGGMFALSSGAIYDRAYSQSRMKEEDFDRRIPADDYGFSKYICAKAIGGMECVTEMRLFGVFGPYEDWRVRFLSNACCRAVWDMPVWIRQNVFFDYLDVEDLGWILEAFTRNKPRHKHYNVCTGRAFDLKTLAGMVVEASGKKLEIVVRNQGLGNEYSGDNHRLLGELPDFHFREMRESVQRLYCWYEARKAAIDPAALHFDE
jgi:nucleoside-diphosphate-sugar epimerase